MNLDKVITAMLLLFLAACLCCLILMLGIAFHPLFAIIGIPFVIVLFGLMIWEDCR